LFFLLTSTGLGFNPRARRGRDRGIDHRVIAEIVSIHAPARGATPPGFRVGAVSVKFVSIHGPKNSRPEKQYNPTLKNPTCKPEMTPEDLKKWRQDMGYNQREAADALGLTLPAYQQKEKGVSWITKKPIVIDRRVALACAALKAGLAPEGD
jgi:DNA-binding XRE family transcriptional regulator